MKIFFTTIVLFASTNLFAQNSNVKGVITYFFNEYQGDKPDIGAKVYLVKKENAPQVNTMTVDSFLMGKFYLGLYSEYIEIVSDSEFLMKQYEGKKRYKIQYEEAKKRYDEAKASQNDHYEQTKKYRMETKEKFKAFDSRAFNLTYGITLNRKAEISTVDAIGNYSLNIEPGKYYILILSKNRKDNNLTESDGKIFLKEIELEKGKTIDISYNFGLR